ncbi:glycosyl hydrolase family 28-related protein [Baaleninema simplex]|uniref:glycosyl hydrolase family 28-related protein n=1 Tax=Baaleninema simplex TaxID=2862350 RepID=UPI000345CDD4|nr:glycosyl hydrolase family 28-related protein [Baaleninema simplex]
MLNLLNSLTRWRTRPIWVGLAAACTVIAIALHAFDVQILPPSTAPLAAVPSVEAALPSDPDIVNVTQAPYNAKGDGVSDDTTAIQQAISQNRGKLIYFPNGTYIVRDTIHIRDENGRQKRFFLQGQSQQNTTIRLIDRAPGFQERSQPKPLLTFWEGRVGDATAFRNTLSHITLDTGRSNPGAIALRFRANNYGSVHHVTLRTPDRQGRYGLDLSPPLNGPLLVDNLAVDGFDIGIYFTGALHSATLSHIDLRHQREYGIYNRRQVLNVEDLTSRNRVPALYNDSDGEGGNGHGIVTLANATLNSDAASEAAVVNSRDGGLYLRNLTSNGYRRALSSTVDDITATANSPVAEFVSHPVLTLFPSSDTALNLPIEPTPETVWDDLADWVKADGDAEDDTAALQRAIDSGKSTVYLTRAEYTINDTVEIRGNVQRIVGLGATRIMAGEGLKNTNRPVFRLVDGTADIVSIEGMEAYLRSAYFVEQASPRTLVLRHLGAGGYRNRAPGSRLFLEDVVGDRFDFGNQQVWGRQLDVEAKRESGKTNIQNDGADVWILGLKTEGDVVLIETKNGGRTELLGGFLYGHRDIPENTPAFLDRDSSQSLVFAGYHSAFQPYVREIRNGETRDLDLDALYPMKYGKMSPLFVGSQP